MRGAQARQRRSALLPVREAFRAFDFFINIKDLEMLNGLLNQAFKYSRKPLKTKENLKYLNAFAAVELIEQ